MANMRKHLLDPWIDAADIAKRIAAPETLLVVVIGAQAWCQKCRDFYPAFCRYTQQAQGQDVYCWLDMEEHQEFLGRFVPETLPWLCVYQGQQILASCEITPDELAVQIERALRQRISDVMEPGIVARLEKADWAID